ncbi:sensor histidine kinase, partial [filamentous cyanobacterium CCP2]
LNPTPLAELRKIAGEDAPSIITSLIRCYLQEAPALIAQIKQAIVHADAALLNRAAHTLKSSSASLGAMMLSQHCEALEVLGREGKMSSDINLPQIEAAFELVKAALEAELRSNEAPLDKG